MKTNLNIFYNLNESFNEELKKKRKLKEADLNDYKDEDEAAYYRYKELYRYTPIEKYLNELKKAEKACKNKGIKLYKDADEKYEKEHKMNEATINDDATILEGLVNFLNDNNITADNMDENNDLVEKYLAENKIGIKSYIPTVYKVDKDDYGTIGRINFNKKANGWEYYTSSITTENDKMNEDINSLTPTKIEDTVNFIPVEEDLTDINDIVNKYVLIKNGYHQIIEVKPEGDKYVVSFAASTDGNIPGGEFEPATFDEINNLQLYVTENDESEKLTEDDTIIIPDVDIEPDYIINDVTVLDNVGDGDVQSPDIDALLTLVNENLSAKYGNDWGHINVLSSKVNENDAYALIDITTKEILREFEDKGIKDVAIGKSLILENAGKLHNFKVNSLNGVTRFSKKTSDPAKTITEWIETEYLHEAKNELDTKLYEERTKAEKEAVENYLKTRMDLIQAIENINMFIELSKTVKAADEMKPAIQDRMYGLAVEFPANIEVTNKDDKYELTFDGRDQIVEIIFGKEWVKEPTEDNKVPEMVTPKQGLKEEADFVIEEYYSNEEDAKEAAKKYSQSKINFNGSEYELLVPAKEYYSNGSLTESYQQFNIGEIEVVFNPDTYECLYSIPSAEVKDKKINLSDVPSVATPYDTNTIIKSYVETKFGRIPTEEEVEDKETIEQKEVVEPDGEDKVTTEVTTTEDLPTDEPVEEAELPDEPDAEPTDDDVNVDINADDVDQDTQEQQSETGSATFVKIRPKQHTSIEDVRERLLDGDTPQSNYIVVDEIDLAEEDWNNLTNDLTTPQAFLEGVQSLDRKNYSFNVVKVTSAAANYTLLIDPLGYNYPRYISVVD